jgi:octaprenyl-diphosphate synthase
MADVWEAYRADLDRIDDYIRRNLASSVTLVNTVAAHILNSGGKRLRPLLVLLSARLCGDTSSRPLTLGSLVEFIHTATLLHDDVVDDADLRRGRQTARKVWGNQISILVGDYLYSHAVRQVAALHDHAINDALAEACSRMAEGEVLQLHHHGSITMTEEDYLRIIKHKTASLIAVSCRIGAIISQASEEQQVALHRFGESIGIAFQIADDTLDYTADGALLGKTLGQDLREGKITLPLLHLIQHCPQADREMIENRLETRRLSEGDLQRIITLMQHYGSITYAMERARTYVRSAIRNLTMFDDSPAKRALVIVAHYMVNRDR